MYEVDGKTNEQTTDTVKKFIFMHVKSYSEGNIQSELNIMNPYLESIFVQTKHSIIGNMYRPPNSNLDTFLSDTGLLLESLTTENDNLDIIITGDFNIDFLKNKFKFEIL